ncbi:unnamed protein product [Urochloa humidicola]
MSAWIIRRSHQVNQNDPRRAISRINQLPARRSACGGGAPAQQQLPVGEKRREVAGLPGLVVDVAASAGVGVDWRSWAGTWAPRRRGTAPAARRRTTTAQQVGGSGQEEDAEERGGAGGDGGENAH